MKVSFLTGVIALFRLDRYRSRLPASCYFAPDICSPPPSWLGRQRAAPFLKERDTNGLCASAHAIFR